jgi:hypothetical protein
VGLPPGIFFPSDPTAGDTSSDQGGGFDWGNVVKTGLSAFQVWSNYDLAKRAENAQRPTTFQTGINGSPVVTGGGAPNLGLTGQNSIFGKALGTAGGSSLILIVVIVLVVVLLVARR